MAIACITVQKGLLQSMSADVWGKKKAIALFP
jgi:hypothetical protein